MTTRRAAHRLARLLISKQHVGRVELAGSGISQLLHLSTSQQGLSTHSLLPAAPSQLPFSLLPARSFSTSFLEKKRRALALQQQQEQQLVSTSQPTAVTSPPPAPASPETALTTVVPSQTQASDEQVEQVVGHTALVITRPIEWGTVILGYEQANRYTIYDQDGIPVAQLLEDMKGLGDAIGRQVLRTRRSFTATVFSADGIQVIFKLRRPMYLINSTMFIEDALGNTIGEVRQKWHPIRRNYDLYIGKKQFAAISGTFLAWEFELKDETGGTLALIDRNFQGFAKEIFTDAGKYVIHYGKKYDPQQAAQPPPSEPEPQATGQPPASSSASQPPSSTGAGSSAEATAIIPTITGNQLAVRRMLHLTERMAVLAAAITIDYDFFSQHSHSGGFLGTPIIYPVPGGGAAPVEGGAPAGEPGAGVPGAASAGAAGEVTGTAADGGLGSRSTTSGVEGQPEAGPPGQQSSSEMNLGGDEFQPPPDQQQGWGSGEEMKWDLPEGGGGGGEEGGSSGIIGMLWGLLGGGD